MSNYWSAKTSICPVCKKKVLDVGMRNHIIGRMKQEIVIRFLEIVDLETDIVNITYVDSKQTMPHLFYFKNNQEVITKQSIKIQI